MADTAAARMSQAHAAATRLGAANVDDLGRAVLLLAMEVAVLSDRQRVLEAVLETRGIAVAEAVRDFRPEGAFAESLSADRTRLAKLIVEALCPPAA